MYIPSEAVLLNGSLAGIPSKAPEKKLNEMDRDQVDTNTESISAHMKKALPDDFGEEPFFMYIYPPYILVFQVSFTNFQLIEETLNFMEW
jgi:hypothetical protein